MAMTIMILFFTAAVIGVVMLVRARASRAHRVPIAVRRGRETDDRGG